MSLRDIERVLYFEAWCVIEPGMTPLKRGQIMSDDDFLAKTEEYGDDFHARVREAYLELAAAEPGRFVVIDAREPIESIALAIRERVERLLPSPA